MSVPTSTVVTGPTNGVMSQGQMTDFSVSNLLISKISDVMKNDFTLSVANICKLLLLLCSGEIKNYVNDILSCIFKYIKQFPDLAYKIAEYMSNKYKVKEQEQKIVNDNHDYKKNVICIKMEFNFMIELYHYINRNKNCSFRENVDRGEVKNTKENIIVIELTNIIIKFPTYDLVIIDPLLYSYDFSKNEIKEIKVNTNSLQNGSRYSDLLTDDQKEIVIKIYNHICTLAETAKKPTNQYITECGDWINSSDDKFFTEESIVDMIIEKYPLFNKEITFIEVVIVGSIYYNITNNYPVQYAVNTLEKTGKMFFTANVQYTFDKTKNTGIQTRICLTQFIPNMFILLNLQKEDIRNKFISMSLNTNTNVDCKVSGYDINMIIKTDTEYNKKDIITNFITTIHNSHEKVSTKTQIFFVKLIDDITVKELPNPEYTNYENKKKLIEQMKITDESTKLEFSKFLHEQVPSKVITEEIIKKKIECVKLNEIEKTFKTLFLRKTDKEILLESLNMFKNQSHILQDLGIQNKFNLLLYGDPGTGKSTTIQAVANYLQKDIYYVDLQKAVYNEDLQMVFEYVNKNIPNGGIIVIEDIDAMTDVLLKRTGKINEYSMSDLVSNSKSKLTLEYFLNILQGTLTIENSVFIVTTNHIDHLDPAFYRDGRFDVKIELKLCDRHQIKSIYSMMLGIDIPNKLLDKIPENKFSPASLIYHIKNYIFRTNKDPEKILEPFLML